MTYIVTLIAVLVVAVYVQIIIDYVKEKRK